MAQRYKFSVESKSFPLDISGEPEVPSEKSGFSLDRESEELTSGDGEDVWEN